MAQLQSQSFVEFALAHDLKVEQGILRSHKGENGEFTTFVVPSNTEVYAYVDSNGEPQTTNWLSLTLGKKTQEKIGQLTEESLLKHLAEFQVAKTTSESGNESWTMFLPAEGIAGLAQAWAAILAARV
jgi:hypothetical protein